MPVPLIKSLADQYRVSPATVEAMWKACKDAIQPSESGGAGTGKPGWGTVVDCVKDKLRNRSRSNATAAVREKRGE